MNDFDVIETLKDILVDILDIEDIDNFNVTEESGIEDFPEWDSLAHINIIIQLEACYGIKFSLDEVENFLTIKDITQTIIAKC